MVAVEVTGGPTIEFVPGRKVNAVILWHICILLLILSSPRHDSLTDGEQTEGDIPSER